MKATHQLNGFDLSLEELAEWYMKLQDVGSAHDVDLIALEEHSQTHSIRAFNRPILACCPASCARYSSRMRLGAPRPYCLQYISIRFTRVLDLLDGLVDIYLPDFNAWMGSTSQRVLKADDYASIAKESIKNDTCLSW